MKAPSKTVRNSIFTYLTKRTTIVASETHYIDHKFDLVSLAPGMEKAWIDDFVAGLLRMVGKVPHADVRIRIPTDRPRFTNKSSSEFSVAPKTG
jgi:hypothetical protein